MEIDSQINTEIFDIPIWSAPFGQVLLDNIDYNSKSEKILDIGFGNGFPLLELSQRYGGSTQVYGVESEDSNINLLKNKITSNKISNVNVTKGNAENLPFDDNYFDLIVSNNGINNVDNIEKAINECSRVCKPNGNFVFTFNLNGTYSNFYKVFNQILKDDNLTEEIEKIKNHINKKRPPLDRIKMYLTKANFKILEITNSHFNMSFSDGTSFFNHYFIKKYFLPEWRDIVRKEKRDLIIEEIENKLNSISKNGFLKFGVPFVCIKSKKIINDNN